MHESMNEGERQEVIKSTERAVKLNLENIEVYTGYNPFINRETVERSLETLDRILNILDDLGVDTGESRQKKQELEPKYREELVKDALSTLDKKIKSYQGSTPYLYMAESLKEEIEIAEDIISKAKNLNIDISNTGEVIKNAKAELQKIETALELNSKRNKTDEELEDVATRFVEDQNKSDINYEDIVYDIEDWGGLDYEERHEVYADWTKADLIHYARLIRQKME